MRTSIVLLVSLSVLWALVSVATANSELIRRDNVSLIYFAWKSELTKPISFGVDQELSVSLSRIITTNDKGGGFFHRLVGRCLFTDIRGKAAKTFEQHGYCAYSDSDGDRVWQNIDADKQPSGTSFAAKGEWTWGTGKYSGIGGSVEIRSTGIDTEEVMKGFGKETGSYELWGK
jgi:hypothetical protein